MSADMVTPVLRQTEAVIEAFRNVKDRRQFGALLMHYPSLAVQLEELNDLWVEGEKSSSTALDAEPLST